MESLTNESVSEETVPMPKSIFKRQTGTSIPGFDVSLNGSITNNAQINKSDTSITISAPKKSSIFEKPREPEQHNFSVNFEESNLNSETESSMTADFLKPKLPFKRKVINKTNDIKGNQFDVTFNETSTNVSEKSSSDEVNKDVDDEDTDSFSLATKANPFKKPKHPTKNVFNIDFDETNNDNSALSTTSTKVVFNKKKGNPLDQFQVSFNETNNDLLSEPTDKTENKLSQEDFSKEKVFAKPANENIKDAFNVEYEESDFGENSEVTTTLSGSKGLFKVPVHSSQIFEVSFNPTMPQITSSSQEQISRNRSIINNDSEMNDAEENCTGTDVESCIVNQKSGEKSVLNNDRELNDTEENCPSGNVDSSNKSSSNNDVEITQGNDDRRDEVLNEGQNKGRQLVECEANFENLSSSKSLVNSNCISMISGMYLDQSSVNDENLNNWMSDNPDEDEEIQPPTVPTIPKNASFTGEEPQAPKPVSPIQTCTMTWEEKFNEIVSKSKKKNQLQESTQLNLGKTSKTQAISKPKPNKGQGDEKNKTAKPPKLLKPAYFANKRLYQYIIRKLEPKFGIDTLLQAEQIVLSICDTVKKVERRKTHQKKLIQDLKKEMASVGLIETTVDFYEFVIKFLPDSFRVKVIPCLQPITNTVYPPKDTISPFDKIL